MAAIFVRFSIDTVSHVCLEEAKIPFITAPSPPSGALGQHIKRRPMGVDAAIESIGNELN